MTDLASRPGQPGPEPTPDPAGPGNDQIPVELPPPGGERAPQAPPEPQA